MSFSGFRIGTALLIASCASPTLAMSWDLLFVVESEYRQFIEEPKHDGQGGSGSSIAMRAEIRGDWNDSADRVVVIPFGRWDTEDENRTHTDLREASWTHIGNGWQSLIGVSKVFWGVAESQHLVDIVNQTDLIEHPDGEEKLGQPMLNYTLVLEWGELDLFALVGFRERAFPGRKGRFRSASPVRPSLSEITRSPSNIDWAARWFWTGGNWDIAVSSFSGTSREPTLVSTVDDNGRQVLKPRYPLIDQFGLEAQYTTGATLLKLEAITRSGGEQGHEAAVFGTEYILHGVLDTVSDLGLLTEYNYDSRGRGATTGLGNDLFLGLRWDANDPERTWALLGSMVGLDQDGSFLTLEGGRRMGDRTNLKVEGRWFTESAKADAFYDWRGDTFFQVGVGVYF